MSFGKLYQPFENVLELVELLFVLEKSKCITEIVTETCSNIDITYRYSL